MKILCPTDLSAEANNAVAYAAKLAQQTGSSLTLLNVQMLAELTPAEALFGEEANVRNAQEIFDRQSIEISTLFKIDCRAVVLSTIVSLTSMIKNEAEDHDLIVMGTDGPDTYIESLTGSKTYKLSSESDLPILIIPNGVGYSEIRKVVFAFDYRRIADVPMKHIVAFAQRTNAEIIMLQIIEERWTHQIEMETKGAQMRLSSTYSKAVPLSFETIYADDHEKSLKDSIISFKADVIAIAYHKQGIRDRLFHKSKTRQIISGASYPLLVVHS